MNLALAAALAWGACASAATHEKAAAPAELRLEHPSAELDLPAFESVRAHIQDWQADERREFQASEAAIDADVLRQVAELSVPAWHEHIDKSPIKPETAALARRTIETLAPLAARPGGGAMAAERAKTLFDGSGEEASEAGAIVGDWLEHVDRVRRFQLRLRLPEAFERSVTAATAISARRLENEAAARPGDPAPAAARRLIGRLSGLRMAGSYVSRNTETAQTILRPAFDALAGILARPAPLASLETAVKDLVRGHMLDFFARGGLQIATKGDVDLHISGRKVPVGMNDAGQIETLGDLMGFWTALANDFANDRAAIDAPGPYLAANAYAAEGLEEAARLLIGESALPPAESRIFRAIARVRVAALRMTADAAEAERLETEALSEIHRTRGLPITHQEMARRIEAIAERHIRSMEAVGRRKSFTVHAGGLPS